jgi:hypothetical protein
MPFQCYIPRASLRSASIGGVFVTACGLSRLIPDQWLAQAELLERGRLVRLSYTFCTIEVAGQCLDRIFEDAGIGKLGAVQVAPPQEERATGLWVSSIVLSTADAASSVPFQSGCSNA